MTDVILPTVAIVATGGTIAMKTDPVTHAPVPALSGADLVAAAPGLEKLARITVTEFSNIPSAEMGPDLWPSLTRTVEGLLGDPEIAGVVVLHGTDTLDTTAYFLDLTLRSDKPVVVIGAQRNASDPDSDGARNLLNAVRQILTPAAASLGVTVTLNHAINAAREVRKTHTHNVETFHSGETGYLGTIDEDRVVIRRTPLRRQTLPLPERLARIAIVGDVCRCRWQPDPPCRGERRGRDRGGRPRHGQRQCRAPQCDQERHRPGCRHRHRHQAGKTAAPCRSTASPAAEAP